MRNDKNKYELLADFLKAEESSFKKDELSLRNLTVGYINLLFKVLKEKPQQAIEILDTFNKSIDSSNAQAWGNNAATVNASKDFVKDKLHTIAQGHANDHFKRTGVCTDLVDARSIPVSGLNQEQLDKMLDKKAKPPIPDRSTKPKLLSSTSLSSSQGHKMIELTPVSIIDNLVQVVSDFIKSIKELFTDKVAVKSNNETQR